MKIQVGKRPVTGSNLVGREREIQEVEQCVSIGQSVTLIAPRRYGKADLLLDLRSSLLYQNDGQTSAVSQRHFS